ncbi:hypothetical protein [Hoylesella pleuritidis]|uniref:hypothetical protein n=1 Tax=Hoylesella pleuritidis TaxID=407975 RepID=UPI0028D50A06|nr:hypothetical protein [Hoylesella pleuritidis]
MGYWEELKEKIKGKEYVEFQQVRYRNEQIVAMKINGMPVSTNRLKTDYTVEKVYNSRHDIMQLAFNIDDNIASVFPTQYQAGMDMVVDLEKIKCKAVINVDMNTGHIGEIVNHKEVVEAWEDYKEHFRDKYKFLRSSATQNAVQQFLETQDKLILDQEMMKAEMNSKMFYMLVFDHYLVGKQEYNEPYAITFPSQLFKGISFPMTMTPKIHQESPNKVVYDRNGSVDEHVTSSSDIVRFYDEQFKPTIQYKFTQYRPSFNIRETVNEAERHIENAEVRLIEEVVNNVDLTILCKLRKIE